MSNVSGFKRLSKGYIKVRNNKQTIINFFVLSISTLALYLRLAKLAGHALNGDELYQINWAMKTTSLFDAIKALTYSEYCSYLSGDYFLVYPFVKLFSFNKWGLAIPHIIATILGFYLLYLNCRVYLKSITGYCITFLIVCFNATLINHATEIRTYAVMPTLALGVLYCSHLLFERPRLSNKHRFLIGIFFVLVIWFHVYGILILSVPFCFCLLSKSREKSFTASLKSNLTLFIMVLCSAMPLWFYSVFGRHLPYVFNGPFNYIFNWIPNPIYNPLGFLKAIFGNLVGYKILYPLLLGVLFPFILPYKDRFKQIGFLFITVIIPIQLLVLVSLKIGYWFLQRQFIWIMPFFAFFLGWSWESFMFYIVNKINYHNARVRG